MIFVIGYNRFVFRLENGRMIKWNDKHIKYSC